MRCKYFTLIELLVVISIIAILFSLLLPGLKTAKESARAIACKNQMRQIGAYMFSYTGEYGEYMPYCMSTTYQNSYCGASNLMPSKEYIGYEAYAVRFSSKSLYRCPSYSTENNQYYYVSYGYNVHLYLYGARKLSSILAPSRTLFLLEKSWHSDQSSNYPWYSLFVTPGTTNYLGTSLGRRHNGKGNIFYIDNHVDDWKTSLPSLADTFWTGL